MVPSHGDDILFEILNPAFDEDIHVQAGMIDLWRLYFVMYELG